MDKWVRLSDWVEKIVGKGEIARHEQFLFPQCFQKLSVADASKRVFMELNESLISFSCSWDVTC